MNLSLSVKKVIKALDVIINNQLLRINSISTDTYSTMLKSFNKINIRPGLKHCFFISYDPHALQLLIKDILQYSAYPNTVKAAI
jgi:hypothetical protein